MILGPIIILFSFSWMDGLVLFFVIQISGRKHDFIFRTYDVSVGKKKNGQTVLI